MGREYMRYHAILSGAFLAILSSVVSASALPISPSALLPAAESADLRIDVAARGGGGGGSRATASHGANRSANVNRSGSANRSANVSRSGNANRNTNVNRSANR